jgi:hypothetical protein
MGVIVGGMAVAVSVGTGVSVNSTTCEGVTLFPQALKSKLPVMIEKHMIFSKFFFIIEISLPFIIFVFRYFSYAQQDCQKTEFFEVRVSYSTADYSVQRH